MKRCLVTGGAGFIGSHLVDYLINEGHEVVVIDDLSSGYIENVNKKAKLIKKDLIEIDLKGNLLRDIDIVYHFAAFPAEGLSLFMPYYTAQKNYMAFLKLLTSCINYKLKTFVFASSVAVYGNNPKVPFDESCPRMPVDPYGVSKAICEQLLEIYGEEYGFNYVILRLHNVYGIRQNLADPYRNVLGIWINMILNGRAPFIYGDGDQTRALTYIDDIVPYIAKSAFAENCYKEVINLGGGIAYKLKDVCQMLLDTLGVKLNPIHLPPRPKEVKHAYCTTEKSIALLGFKESVTLESGIKKMVNWAKNITVPKFRYIDERLYELKQNMPRNWLDKQM